MWLWSVALRLLACGAVSYGAWLAIGPIGLVWCAPLFGAALARPLLEAVGHGHRLLRARVYRDVEGRHHAYQGISIGVALDDDGQPWLRLADVRKVLPGLPRDEALRLILGAQLQPLPPDRAPTSAKGRGRPAWAAPGRGGPIRHGPTHLHLMTSATPRSPWPSLAGWLLVTVAASAIGAAASVDAAAFYARLDKPAWAPPAWVFGPVWSVLYTLMGIAAWLVWRSPQRSRAALWLFAWHLGAWATAEVLLLLGLIVLTVRAFHASSRLAARLLLPYLLWVSFASVLTVTLWRGNPSLLS